jgi:hypothetical protein
MTHAYQAEKETENMLVQGFDGSDSEQTTIEVVDLMNS